MLPSTVLPSGSSSMRPKWISGDVFVRRNVVQSVMLGRYGEPLNAF